MIKDNLTSFKQFVEFCRNNVSIEVPTNDLSEEMVLRCKNGSKIHIKKSHEGRFTKYCKGKVTDECIRKGKNSSDPKIRKMATFAKNSRGWSH